MPPITPDALLFAGLIFILRVFNYAIGTVRTIAIARQQRLLTTALAFVEALVFALAIANVIKDLNNILNLLSYCLGAAAGGYVGMALESRLITSYMTVNIITTNSTQALAEALRERGFGVTELTGTGRDGTIKMLSTVVFGRDVMGVTHTVHEFDPKAFVTVSEARSIEQGWLRSMRSAPYRREGG